MKTKIVYVLVSQESDFYYEMLLLSLHSLRLYHSREDTEVVVVMDQDTHTRLQEMRATLLKEITPLPVDVPSDYSIKQRSRYLKTNLRELLRGDFLYLDTDTVVYSSLEDVDRFEGDICAVLDNHTEQYISDQINSLPKSLDWGCITKVKPYNSGVMYVKESKKAHNFFLKWHENWKKSASYNFNFDQPALSKSIYDTNFLVHEISGIWNCQVRVEFSSQFLDTAKIIHYFTGWLNFQICNDALFLKIKYIGKMPDDVINLLLQSRQSFFKHYTLVSNQEELLLNDMLASKKDYPLYFNFIIKLSSLHRSVRKALWRFRRKLVM